MQRQEGPTSDRPLRIAFLSPLFVTEPSPDVSGLATYLDRISRVLREMGHEVEVFTLTPQRSGVLDHRGMRVQLVHAREVRWLRALGRLSRIHPRLDLSDTCWNIRGAMGLARALEKREGPRPFDLVQCSDLGLPGLFAPKRAGRPLLVRSSWARDLVAAVSTRPASLDEQLQMRLERLCYRRADAAYAPSRFVADHLSRVCGIPVSVLRPPFYLEVEPDGPLPEGLPSRYLIHFGLLCPRKGTDVLAEALTLAWREEPELSMVWAGREYDAPGLVERCRAAWGPRADRVLMLGPIGKATLYAIVKRAEASVIPSRDDNLPNSAMESLLLGVPVIGSLGASIDELVEPGVCGELVPIGDAPALAAAMLRAWRKEASWCGPGFRLPATVRELEPRVAASALLSLAGFRPPFERTSRGEPSADAVAARSEAPELGRQGLLSRLSCRLSALRDAAYNAATRLTRLAFGKSVGSISAAPNPLVLPEGTGTGATTLVWTSRGADRLEIRIGAPDGPLFSETGHAGDATTGDWVRDGTVAYLLDASSGRPAKTGGALARVTIRVVET